MTASETILSTLRKFGRGLCDDCLSKITGITPRQTINQRCRELLIGRSIERSAQRCAECNSDKLVNWVERTPATIAPLTITEKKPVALTETPSGRTWCWEGSIQDAITRYLVASGSVVGRTANTASKEHGKDIIASGMAGTANDGKLLWVTVKGYPEKRPDQQSRHWFAEIVYDLVRYRTEHETVVLAAGLPDHRIYRMLSHRVAWLKRELPFRFYWVREDGNVIVE